MANTPDLSTCNERKSDGQLPVDPWRSLAVHFGMLLGVDDFRAIGAYHRGKQWLHNGWLHREGVVWGLVPSFDEPSGELRLEPGLAIDPAGRELHLERRACIDLGKWFAEQLGDEPAADSKTIDAHVRIRFVSCATNQVPAMVEPCEGSGRITAYSRVFETVEIELVEGLPNDPPLRYPRLRLLFGLDDGAASLDAAEAQEIRDARADVLANVPPDQQPSRFVTLFRRYAARDAARLEPGKSDDGKLQVGEGVLTDVDPAWLTIATLRDLTFKATLADGEVASWSVEPPFRLVWTSRATHVATWDLEDLIAASLACCGPTASSQPGVTPGGGDVERPLMPGREPEPSVESGGTDVDAAKIPGPRVTLGDFNLLSGTLALDFDKPVSEKSTTDQLDIAAYDEVNGWRSLTIQDFNLAPNGRSVRVRFEPLTGLPTAVRLRFGHNEPPVLGENGWPLAGGANEPAPLPDHGRPFIHVHRPRRDP